MEPTQEEIAAHYTALENAPLLTLAEERDDLTDENQALLIDELQRRGLSVPSIVPQSQQQYDAQTWVTVERFRDLSSALVARGALEALGIPCYLRDENTVRLDWQISDFIGGMRLQVPAAEEEAARTVLQGMALEEEPASDAGPALPDERCPLCGSMNIARQQRYYSFSVLSVWLFGLPFALRKGKPMWRCEVCHAAWRD